MGGIVFDDESNPLFSGVNGVAVHIEGINGTVADIDLVTSGQAPATGNWNAELFEGTYRISMTLTGFCFTEYLSGRTGGADAVHCDGQSEFRLQLPGQSVHLCLSELAEPCPCDDQRR